ncbi:MAG TPA: hypothetical protein VGP99_13235 [Tepidisphaeraceae bacterium]|jgi:hypothetical protein|nr:hypothetical protein [Tepidisphaeraceae bacterium]
MLRILIAISASLLVGCAAKRNQSDLSGDYPGAIQNQSRMTNRTLQTTDEMEKPVTRRVIAPADPPVIFRPTVNLSIYHLRVPVGTVSGNDEFWKRVDEHAVDITAYDVLYKNGIRVGRAPISELEAFLKILDRNPMQTLPTVFAASGAKTIELPMKKGALDQILYDFDLKNTLTVRSYEECDNIFCVEFSPAPRKAGDVRISLCPMVRTLRKRLVATGDIDTREVEYKSPEKYFQLNLRTDIPLDGFLVLGPSPEAKSTMSLGHAFFMLGGATEQQEDVLLILPQAMKPRPEKTDVQISIDDKK